MDILWIAFELSATLFQSFIFIWFIKNFLTTKLVGRYDRIAFVIAILVDFTIVTISNSIIDFEGVAVLLFSIPLLLYATFCLNGTIAKKLVVLILPTLINAIIASLMFHVISSLFSTTIEEILSGARIERFLLIIIANLILVYVFSMILRFVKKNEIRLRKAEFVVVLSVFIISAIIAT